MIFNFKKKNITLDAFTYLDGYNDYFPVAPSMNHLPQWWKKLPKENLRRQKNNVVEVPVSTMKRCSGFIDLYKNSFTLPMWSDLKIKVDKENGWNYLFAVNDNNLSSIAEHDTDQFGNSFPNQYHLKLQVPWIINEKTGANFLFTGPMWSMTEQLNYVNILTGVLDFKYQSSLNVNMFIPKDNYDVTFTAGEPIAMIIPMTENNVKIKTHVIDIKEWESKRSYGSTLNFSFTGNHLKTKKLDKKKTCPFGFGK